MVVIKEPVKFSWDKGNQDKNWVKHKVLSQECEEIFSDVNKRLYKDPIHSEEENRYILLGMTKSCRLLFIVFTMRGNKVRVISARDINKRERSLYEEKTNIA